jgi:hypothetical protein
MGSKKEKSKHKHRSKGKDKKRKKEKRSSKDRRRSRSPSESSGASSGSDGERVNVNRQLTMGRSAARAVREILAYNTSLRKELREVGLQEAAHSPPSHSCRPSMRHGSDA